MKKNFTKEEVESTPSTPMPTGIDYYYRVGRFITVMLLVVCLGVFAVNQALEFRFKSVFLQTPCQLCGDLNKKQAPCIDACFKPSVTEYSNPFGEINITMKEIS